MSYPDLLQRVTALTAENERLRVRVSTLEPIAGVAEKIAPGGGQVKIMPAEVWDDVWGRIVQAEARVRALEEDVQELNRALAVEAETVAAMRVVLQKYADPRNYDGSPSAIDMDDGEAARAALTEPTPPAGEQHG